MKNVCLAVIVGILSCTAIAQETECSIDGKGEGFMVKQGEGYVQNFGYDLKSAVDLRKALISAKACL